jgi:hypothetical protein
MNYYQYDERKPMECIFKVNHIFRISSGYFGLPKDGAPAAPKQVGARSIF